MNGSLNVLRAWIKNDFDMPIPDLAKLIYYSCHNISSANIIKQ
jgi:hypothetical protein